MSSTRSSVGLGQGEGREFHRYNHAESAWNLNQNICIMMRCHPMSMARDFSMSALNDVKKRLRPGQVYRRQDFEKWSNAVDRHLRQLVEEGRLEKVSGGLYLAPRQTRYGKAPARPEKLVESFLKDDRFLLVSPNAYNGLGVGTTQLYNEPVVYNLKRHGRFDLGGRVYDFRKKSSVPSKLTEEVLLVDLLQNVDRMAESRAEVLPRALHRARSMNAARLFKAARDFGSVRAERLLSQALQAA